MAEMRKVEETCAFPNKHKPDLPNSINETLEQKEDAEDDGSDSNKRQKLEISTENEKNIVCSFSVAEKMAVSKDDKEDDYKADENDIKDDHVKVEADENDIKNGISIEASEEVDIIEEEDDNEEYDSEEYDSEDSEEYDSDYDYSSYDSSDDSSDYSSYDSSDDSFFSDSSGDDYDSSEFSGLDSDSDDIRFL